MIRVLNVLFDDRYGGPQKRAIQVARALAGRVETLLCLPDRSGNAAAIAEREGVAVRRLCFERIPRLRNWRQLARWFLHLPRDTRRFVALYRGEGPDVVHVNGVFFLPPALAAKLTRTPLVWHLNDTVMPAGLARVFGFVVRRLADQVVVSSRAVAGHYHVLGSQPEVLYPPVDPSALALPPRTRRDLQRTPYRMGMIANWNPEKGVEHFIRAAARVREQVGDNLELVFAGGKYASQADYCRRLEELIHQLGLAPRVRDYGFVPSVAEVLAELDVLVSSSLSEAFGMSILEGMAAGVPVVATGVGGVPELLLADAERPAGIVIPSRDEAALAEALLELWRNPEKAARLGENGRQIAGERFGVEACAERHLRVYSNCRRER
ncbi:MAG: glycosyltransferase family 4 protein [Terriglobia bacterium]